MLSMKQLSLLVCLSLPFIGAEEVILRAPDVAPYGVWGPFENCSEGKLVTGFQLKVEGRHSVVDDTALNAVRFFCGHPSKPTNNETVEVPPPVPVWENVTSLIGLFGRWGSIHNCTTYAVGFDLEAQPPQGKYKDDVGASNLKVLCADGAAIEGFINNGVGHQFPNVTYTGAQRCPSGQGICGIQTRVEPYQVFGDDTGLNSLAVKCCPVNLSELITGYGLHFKFGRI